MVFPKDFLENGKKNQQARKKHLKNYTACKELTALETEDSYMPSYQNVLCIPFSELFAEGK